MRINGMRVLVAAAAITVSWLGTAEARNPNCAGGIQYLSQALTDKEKRNIEDYQREITKAVQRLEMCAAEDTADYEGIGYLGWAYAEVDSAGPAGRAFADAIRKLSGKGDKKKADLVSTNRDHYWSITFNDGIASVTTAQTLYPDFGKEPANEEEKGKKAEARKAYEKAIVSLTRASLLKPGDPRTLRNLGAVYAFMGDFGTAERWFKEGLQAAPADSELIASMHSVRVNRGNELVEQKKYDEAIAVYGDLAKSAPSDFQMHGALADVHFRKAQTLEGDARKGEFKTAGDLYAKAGQLKPDAADYPFNAALAYQNAGDYALAEAQWKASLKARPDDVDALSSLGATLAELKKFDEGVRVLHQAVLADPKNQNLHRQLGAVYTKAGNNAKGTEELMVYLALHNGQTVADPAAEAKKAPAGSAAAKMLSTSGPPDQINRWEADAEKYETWFYWAKNSAYHFKAGALIQKSEWGAADAKATTGAK